MFSPDIVSSDAFLDMPISSQVLYFHLCMRSDDDGFVTPKMVMRLIGSGEDDLKVLIAKRFILPFESGVIVIKHWLIHNLIRADLYKETLYKKEKSTLGLNENGAYTELRAGVSEIEKIESPEWLKKRRGDLRTVNVPQTALRLGKDRLGKDSKDKNSYGVLVNVRLSDDEHQKLCYTYGRSATNQLIEELSTYIPNAKTTYKNHYATLLNWARRKKIEEVKHTVIKQEEEIELMPEQVERNRVLRENIRKITRREISL